MGSRSDGAGDVVGDEPQVLSLLAFASTTVQILTAEELVRDTCLLRSVWRILRTLMLSAKLRVRASSFLESSSRVAARCVQ
jgi:hypothetical protein